MNWEPVRTSKTVHHEREANSPIATATFFFETSDNGGYLVRCHVSPCGCYKTLLDVNRLHKGRKELLHNTDFELSPCGTQCRVFPRQE